MFNKIDRTTYCLILFSIIACNTSNNKTEETKTTAQDSTVVLQEEQVNYTVGDDNMQGYIAYNESEETKKPGVLVVHEWWGLDEYTKKRVRDLAALGYVAFAVDMYGNGQIADNPDDALKLAVPNYQNPQLAKSKFDAALAKLKTFDAVDTSRIAAIGYCFGGSMVLNMARMGDDLKAVVSFHGGLKGVPANKELLKANILVCHGAEDKNVPQEEVQQFKKELDSIGVAYTFKEYPNATHAFTNPASTENGKKFNLPIAYNAAADAASWNDMKAFFAENLNK